MNVLTCVFNENNGNHLKFKPVKDWILQGKGKMVVGGTTYFQELEKLPKIRRFYLQLRKAGKAVNVKPEKDIDDLEKKLKSELDHRDFDDPHLVALLITSGCQVICSNDSRAYSYFQRKEWYPKGHTVPKIYCEKSYSNKKNILNDYNLAEICMPCNKLNKQQIENLEQVEV